MAEQLQEHFSRLEISRTATAAISFYYEIGTYRPPRFLQRNLRIALKYHQRRLADDGKPAIRQHAVYEPHQAEDLTGSLSNAAIDGAKSDGHGAVSRIDAISKHTLLARMEDPGFEPQRRSSRGQMRKQLDDDEAILFMAPISIRKKINFKTNRPSEDERPRTRYKRGRVDRSVARTKCHCSLTIWDNRHDLAEQDTKRVETHSNCILTWAHTEQHGKVVDIDMDKPFQVRAGDLKVPLQRDGDTLLGMSKNYFMELKIWPSSKDRPPWPPIPLLESKADGVVNRPNKSAHTILGDSLVAKYGQLPTTPSADVPLSLFYLDSSGVMLRTKYGLELSGEWRESDMAIDLDPPPADLSWVTDDNGNAFGRPQLESIPERRPRKRPRCTSPLVSTPRARPTPKSSTKLAPREPSVDYIWEADRNAKHLTQDTFLTTTISGLTCPCRTFTAPDLQELRLHFLLSHEKLNFDLEEREVDETTGRIIAVTFRIRSTLPSGRRLETQLTNTFIYQASTDPFDLEAYLNGDTSWTGVSPARSVPVIKGPRRKDRIVAEPSFSNSSSDARGGQRKPSFRTDPLLEGRRGLHPHLPPDLVPGFRQPKRPKHKPAHLVRKTGDNKMLMYDSIAQRPVYPSEDELSETDDEQGREWYLQHHIESLDVNGDYYDRPPERMELFRRWDRHRCEEQLDGLEFVSESLVRFVRKHKDWLCSDNNEVSNSWMRFLNDLKENRRIDVQVISHVHEMIHGSNRRSQLEREVTPAAQTGKEKDKESASAMGAVSARPGSDYDGDVEMTMAPGHEEGAEATAILPKDPKRVALEAFYKVLISTPVHYCGCCELEIVGGKHAVYCAAPDCKAPQVGYHVDCACRTGEVTHAWACMACQLEAQIAQARTQEKGKGKAVER
jgi:hypothetical protein